MRSENLQKKVTFVTFCEKTHIYVMKELKNGESIVYILTDSNADILKNFEDANKPSVLAKEEKKSFVDQDIYREEVKIYVKDLKVVKSNLKKVYSLVYGNCTDSVRTIIKTDDEYKKRSKSFDSA